MTNAVVDELRVPGMHAGDLWVEGDALFLLGFKAEGPGLELLRMDPATHAVLWRVPVPGQWSQTVFAAGGSVWVLGTAPDARGAIEVTTLYRFDPATGALLEEVGIGADTLVPAVHRDTVWLRVQGGAQRFDAGTGELVGEPIEPDAGCCTGPFVPDGAGGVWVVSSPGDGPERSIWHIDATGRVVATATIEDAATFEAMHGQSYAFDRQTQTIWVQHHRGSVARVRVVTAGG